MDTEAMGFFLERAGEPLVRRRLELPPLEPGEARIEVLACGLCHTDLGFADGSVRTRAPLPLVLGHEAVGRVCELGTGALAALLGKRVLVPAVLPCGRCIFCTSGRGNACPEQKMPGNDVHGGFATHMTAPAHSLLPLPELPDGVDPAIFSVVADAVSTAYQAVRRAGVEKGDLVVVVGAGGVGGHVAQIAAARGARVIACDLRPERLAALAEHGAEQGVEVADRAPRDIRKEIRALAREWGIPSLRLRIFECSGTAPGQILAFTLLDRAATLVQVGYTPKKVELRLSNLMAFDATVLGTWGCPLEAYPEVLALVAEGRVQIEPFVERAPMSRLNDLLADMAAGRLERRMVLDPRT